MSSAYLQRLRKFHLINGLNLHQFSTQNILDHLKYINSNRFLTPLFHSIVWHNIKNNFYNFPINISRPSRPQRATSTFLSSAVLMIAVFIRNTLNDSHGSHRARLLFCMRLAFLNLHFLRQECSPKVPRAIKHFAVFSSNQIHKNSNKNAKLLFLPEITFCLRENHASGACVSIGWSRKCFSGETM